MTLYGDEIPIRDIIQWVWEVEEEEDGFQQIFDGAINNSVVRFDPNEAKLILQISLQCIELNLVPNLLCYHSICGQENFKNLQLWIPFNIWNNMKH